MARKYYIFKKIQGKPMTVIELIGNILYFHIYSSQYMKLCTMMSSIPSLTGNNFNYYLSVLGEQCSEVPACHYALLYNLQ